MVEYPIGELIARQVPLDGGDAVLQDVQARRRLGPEHGRRLQRSRSRRARADRVLQPQQRSGGRLKPGDFDWASIFGSGVRWFHSGGIFASLSETTSALIIEGMQEARKRGAVVSFDLNYREKLWSASGGASRAVAVLGQIVQNVDVLVGNEEDLQKGLGIAGPEVAESRRSIRARLSA